MLYSFSLTIRCSNNNGGIRAFTIGLELALQIAIPKSTIYDNSELIVKQLRVEYSVKKAKLIPYCKRAEEVLKQFEES